MRTIKVLGTLLLVVVACFSVAQTAATKDHAGIEQPYANFPKGVQADGAPNAITFAAPEKLHHLVIESGAISDATFAYSWPGSQLFGCLNASKPDRTFKQKGGTVVVFATGSCSYGNFLPIRGQQTATGWSFEIDAKRDNSHSMKVRFDF